MVSLNDIDSNGVSEEVIDTVERFREDYEDPTNTNRRQIMLTFNMNVSQRDAEYSVECLRVLLQQRSIAQTSLSLDDDEISDEAIDVFGNFLHETPCHLQTLWIWYLPHQQARRLLAALKTNTSVKNLNIYKFHDNEGASWIADLLRHKTDFTHLRLHECSFPFTQILPLLRQGQPNLQLLGLMSSRNSNSNSNCLLLFKDAEITQLFIDNILLSPFTTLKALSGVRCGVSLENRPLMEAFHKNITLVTLYVGDENRLFIDPILRRNRYLGHVNDMLGTRMTTTTSMSLTVPPAGVGEEIVAVPSIIPPPCGLWATVLAKVGEGTQGASPVFTILSDRLATWVFEPSQQWQHVPPQVTQRNLEQEEQDDDSSCTPSQPAILQPDTGATSHGSSVALNDRLVATELVAVASLLENKLLTDFLHDSAKATVAAVGGDHATMHLEMVAGTANGREKIAPTNPPPTSGTEEQQPPCSSKKRGNASTTENNIYSSKKKKKPKSDM